MTYFFSCIYGNKTSTKLGCGPYPLDDYLDISEDDKYNGHNIDEFMKND